MNEARTKSRPAVARGRRVIALAAALLTAALAACSSRPHAAPARSQPGASPFGRAYQDLRAQAERPSSPDPGAPAPPGLDPALAQPLPTDGPEAALARQSLAEALVDLNRPMGPGPARPEPTPEARQAAVHRYVVAREKLLRADVRGAIEDLRAATRLDPAAPEPWRELGEAQLAAGSPSEAAVAIQAAVERGLSEARSLEFLGRLAEDRAEYQQACEWFARAAAAEPRREDPALPLIVRVALGRCLLKTGRLQAGREALTAALELPSRPPSPTRYPQEVAAVYRRQAEFWREVGDADCRLGRYQDALDAYVRAATLPALEEVDLAPRIFFAASRAGRPAAAAVFVLDRVRAADGFVTRDDRDLLAIVSRDPAVAQLLASALATFRRSMPAGASPALVGSLERAGAAVAGPEGAEVLRDHLSRAPSDGAAAADLLAAVPAPVAEAARLAAASPEHAERYAEAIARTVPDADGAAAALKSLPGDPAGLTAAYLLARIGRPEDAWTQLSSLRATGASAPEVHVARARIGAAEGRWDDARLAVSALDRPGAPDAEWARVRALWALRRVDDAVAALRPLLERTPEGDPARLFTQSVLAAELALRSGDAPEAERLLRRATVIDPFDDRPYAIMLSLYGPGGPLADPDRLSATLRDLRENVPDSRLAGFLRSQEFIRRAFFKPAERELLRLAEADPTDPSVLELLSGVWTRMAISKTDPDFVSAMTWLDARIAEHPWADSLTAAKARVLASAGDPEQAESLLRARLAARPTTEAARLLEVLLRDRGRAEEADQSAEARLSRPPLSIDEAIELAELRVRQQRDADAAASLREWTPADVTFDPEQAQRLMSLAGPVIARSKDKEESREAAAWLLDDLVRRHVKLTPEMHEQRLGLLAAIPDAGEERLIAAADDAARDYPQIGAAAYLSLCHALEANKRAPAALAVIERAAATENASIDILWEWLRLVIDAGGAPEARRAIERAAALGQVSALVARAVPQDAPPDASDTREPRGVLAFILAGNASLIGRPDAAEALYALCLEFDPNHPWANNNLGYSLVERGVELDRAERLLEKAHKELPDSASVLDSLGWLRYKLGVITDVVEAESGQTTREGAATLLERAVRTEDGQRNHTILDHCGDAFWAAGRRDEARRMWEYAARRAEAAGRELRRTGQEQAGADDRARDRARKELNEVRMAARRKLEALARGQEPAIAPRAGAEPGE